MLLVHHAGLVQVRRQDLQLPAHIQARTPSKYLVHGEVHLLHRHHGQNVATTEFHYGLSMQKNSRTRASYDPVQPVVGSRESREHRYYSFMRGIQTSTTIN
ncbi:hypothetical protein [Stenotrophomonas sp.]|uniref:hypothetical protein n=1 Tax=Stenotrophomonas sp. TaxID=69392 RepID=UPI0028A86768|nr:hypothetical protein [Stenotrophomonas sp.]